MKTVFKPNPSWWGKPEHNLTEVVFQTIKSDATRVAALLSGDIDMMDPVPVQDIDRMKASPNVSVLIGPELRTIFLNMDSMRDELLYSSVKGKNPFKDARVRKAFYQAIDMEAIHAKVMRGMSVNSALLISPLLYVRAAEFKRHPYDVAAAKKLLADAGYPNGFEVVMDCPNDRYVNDEGDLPGRGADAVAHRHQGEAQRHAEGQVLPEGRADRASTTAPSTCSAGRRARSTAGTCSPTSSAAAMPTAKAAAFNSADTAIQRMTSSAS